MPTISACVSWASFLHSSRPSSVCAGYCASFPAMISPPLPGIASLSASSCWPPHTSAGCNGLSIDCGRRARVGFLCTKFWSGNGCFFIIRINSTCYGFVDQYVLSSGKTNFYGGCDESPANCPSCFWPCLQRCQPRRTPVLQWPLLRFHCQHER